jgi:ribosomal protein S18 acetylase RimI-like enzyme
LFRLHSIRKKCDPDEISFHAAAIAVLAAEIWRGHYIPIIGAAQVEYMLAKFQSAERIFQDITENNYTYYTATDVASERLIGYCAVVRQKDCLLLSKIYVHRDFRGKGVARLFIIELGSNKIRLTVNKNNTDAIAFYRKMGFEIVDSVVTDIGEGFVMDDYVMEL